MCCFQCLAITNRAVRIIHVQDFVHEDKFYISGTNAQDYSYWVSGKDMLSLSETTKPFSE